MLKLALRRLLTRQLGYLQQELFGTRSRLETWQVLLESRNTLHVLEDTLRERPPEPGSYGVLLAMGPGFCSELVLLRADRWMGA